MMSSSMIRPCLRPLAVFISWMMLVVALPIGSLSQATKAAHKGYTVSSGQPAPEATTTGSASKASATDAATQASVAAAYGKLPLSFEANLGQFDRRAHFLARGLGYGLFLTSSEAVMVLSKPVPNKDSKPVSAEQAKIRRLRREQERDAAAKGRAKAVEDVAPETVVLRMKMEGSNPSAQAEGMEELPGKTNYFIGKDPNKWHTDIPSYARVMYRDVYPGIDLVYYGREQQLEYDFRVAPGFDPGAIKLNFDGAQSIEVDAGGDLVLHTKAGDIRQQKPVVYQEVDGARREILSRYVIKDQQRVGFHVEAYDTSKPLVIDPVLLYSTFLGGSGTEEGFSIAVDAAGNAYVAGRTNSLNFPILNPIQSSYHGSGDAFVSKLNADGSALIYSTYIGGTSSDRALSIAVDAGGSAYITGFTFSSDFPLMNPLQATLGGHDDPFVTKLNPRGSALVYSTYLGGSSYESGRGIALDADHNAYVTGFTYSHDFPLVNPFQSTKAGHQAFKSTDGGGTWNVSDTGLDAARLNDLAIDPLNPATLYAATEQGVFKTTDGGGTWQAVNTGIENTGDARRLAINPSNTSTVFVGTDFGLFKSTNGGQTWTPSLAAGFLVIIEAVAIDPVNTSTIYASYGSQLFKSTDGGINWEANPVFDFNFGFLPVSALAINPNNSSTLYAGTFGFGVYKSTDGSENWSPVNTGLEVLFNFFSDSVEDLVIDPSNPSIIYASTGLNGVFKTTDAGQHWSAINTGLPTFTEIPTLAIDPTHPNVIYAGTFGNGLFKSTDGGAHWSAGNTGLTNRAVEGIAIDPTDTSKLYVVTSSLADAFVTKLNASGSARLYSTYLGGDEDDQGNGIALNDGRNAYLTGQTVSLSFPTENPLQASSASPDKFLNDAFVTKLDATGSSLAYSTYLGSNGDDVGTGIAVDHGGNAYVTGYVQQFDSSLPVNFPTTPGAFQTSFQGITDAFVSKLNAAGSSLAYSTYLGGEAPDNAYAIAVNSNGQAFVTGQTSSMDFPLASPTQNTLHDFFDAFVTRLNPTGSALIFSTYLGGTDNSFFTLFDQGNGIAVDSASSAYVIGTTLSPDFPVTPNAFQKTKTGSASDAFITKFGAPLASIRISGRVLLNGQGLGGVTLTLTNRAGSVLQTTVSRSDGFYQFTGLPGGGDYTVTPSKTGYTFSPPFRTYDNLGTNATGQNFTAMLSTFSIFVTVEGIFGNGVPGVKVTLTGSRNAVCTTGSNGFCQFANLPAGGNYTVTPMKSGGTFNPPSKTFNNLSENQGVVFRAYFTISGQVTGAGGIGISGVTVKLIGSNNFHLTDITDSNGHYAFANVPAGGFYMITPMKGGMTFNPEGKDINVLNSAQVIDFQALVSITGKVRLEGTTTGISGVTMKLTGSRTATTTTNSEGIYTFSNLPAGGNYTVTPMKTGYTFDPPSRTFTNLRVSQSPRTASFDGMP